jgi:uroporphyrinogen decarboxylase
MTERDVVRAALRGEHPPYVPWSFRFTREARAVLRSHFGTDEIEAAVGNHILELGSDIGFFEDIGGGRVRDVFGVVWDRTVDKDIGNIEGAVLPGPSLAGYAFPDPLDPRFFADIHEKISLAPNRFRLFCLGFSLFERAWTLRGLENLLADVVENPGFVHELLEAVGDYAVAQVRGALGYDIDAVYFGDDWGHQTGLMLGRAAWREFVKPVLARMFREVTAAGKLVFLHSCGKVDELFDDLADIGLSCFNPFQPEVMDIAAHYAGRRGRLSFWGGLSTQKTLPFGSEKDVRREAERLLAMGAGGHYIFSPAHAVEGDVPLANMLAFIQAARAQPGAPGFDDKPRPIPWFRPPDDDDIIGI